MFRVPYLLTFSPMFQSIAGFLWIYIGGMLFLGFQLAIVAAAVDASIAVTLAVGTGLQSNYIPDSKSRCSHLPTDHRFNHTLSFYELAGRLNDTQVSAEIMCKDFYIEWAVGISIV